MSDKLFVAGVASCKKHIKQGPKAVIYCNEDNPSFIATPYKDGPDCEFCKVELSRTYRLKISSLPDNLSVGGSLYLRGIKITKKNIPKHLKGKVRG